MRKEYSWDIQSEQHKAIICTEWDILPHPQLLRACAIHRILCHQGIPSLQTDKAFPKQELSRTSQYNV